MDVEKYLNGGYEPHLLEHVVAWHNISGKISAHQQDAVMIASEKKK